MASEFVRVKDPGTGHEVSVTADFAKAYKLEPLDKPALDDNGRPLAGKPRVELAPTDGAAGSGNPETDPATSSTTGTSGQTAGKAATK